MSGAPPRRLRRFGARLPYALRRGLSKLPDPDPTPAQLRDLWERLAPLLPRESRAPGALNRTSRGRSSRTPRVGRLRGMIAAALFPVAVAAGVRVARDYRHWVHATAPPIQVERATEATAAPRSKAPAPILTAAPGEAPVDLPRPARPRTEARPTPTLPQKPAPEAPPPLPDAPLPAHTNTGELEMLGRAVAALASDPSKTLALTNEIERTYPDGMLRQEREVLAIKALVRLGDLPAARARLDQFRSRYPTSIHDAQLKRLFP